MQAVLISLLASMTLAASAISAESQTPRVLGSSYAVLVGPGDVVLGRPNGPVRVSARLPAQLGCMEVVAVDWERVDSEAVYRSFLTAAPVTVVLEGVQCEGTWSDRWVDYIVRNPGSDILDVAYVAPDGQPLYDERLAVETSTAGGGSD